MRRKKFAWLVEYKTRDGQTHRLVVQAKSTINAVNICCSQARAKGQSWLKATRAWPYDKTEALPGFRDIIKKHKDMK